MHCWEGGVGTGLQIKKGLVDQSLCGIVISGGEQLTDFVHCSNSTFEFDLATSIVAEKFALESATAFRPMFVDATTRPAKRATGLNQQFTTILVVDFQTE